MRRIEMMQKKIKVMAIGAHSDECHFGCGGALRLLVEVECECMMLHVACHNHVRTPEELEVFDADIDHSAELLGCRHLIIGSRESSLYEGDRHDRSLIMEQLEVFQPDLVFLMWPQDSHPEHRRVAQTTYDAILNSLWNNKLPSIREIYAYEAGPSQSMLYFQPDLYIDISSVFEKLENALTVCIAGEKGAELAQSKADCVRFRGGCAGLQYAEGFKVVKFPEGTGLDASDLLLRRLLANQFRWAGASPWPYGNTYFQN